ncbi:hypothetical protein [Neisseria sp.]|uniref:hypothetical protein n=1 Tax=Neisseria sp. TaxID=192066 RepID=UPI0035A1326C
MKQLLVLTALLAAVPVFAKPNLKQYVHQEVKGISTDTVFSSTGDGYALYNNNGEPLIWGPFSLKSLSVSKNGNNRDEIAITEDVLTTAGEKSLHQFKIGNQTCVLKHNFFSFGNTINFHKKRNVKKKTLNYSDFELAACPKVVPTLFVDGKPLKFKDSIYAWEPPSQRTDGEMPVEFVADDIGGADKPSNNLLVVATGKYVFNYQTTLSAEENGMVTRIGTIATTCARDKDCSKLEKTTKIKLGKCEYPQSLQMYLTDFKDGMATWTVGEQDTRVSPQCESQRLPYKLIKK